MKKIIETQKSLQAFQWVRPASKNSLLGAGYIFRKTQMVTERTRPYYVLLYLLEGGGVYEDELNGRFRIVAGSVLVLFPFLRHSYYRRDLTSWSEAYLVFQGDLFPQLEQDGLLNRRRPVFFPGLQESLRSSFDELIQDYLHSRLRSRQSAIARTHLLLSDIFDLDKKNGGSESTGFVRTACEMLELNLGRPLDLVAIAKKCGFSEVHFRRLFRERVGLSPGQYRICRKIERAKSLLADEKATVAQVARELGYQNLNFFHRQFKQVTGQTPFRLQTSS